MEDDPTSAARDADEPLALAAESPAARRRIDPRRDPAGRRHARRDDGRSVGPAVRASARACTSRPWSTTRSTTGTAPARAGGASTASCSARCPTRSIDALDAADASQLTAVRNESTTPFAALELLNNPFVLRQCETCARRLEGTGHDLGGRIRFAFLLAYSPGSNRGGGRAARRNTPLPHGLPNVCRLLVNSNEFLFVN